MSQSTFLSKANQTRKIVWLLLFVVLSTASSFLVFGTPSAQAKEAPASSNLARLIPVARMSGNISSNSLPPSSPPVRPLFSPSPVPTVTLSVPSSTFVGQNFTFQVTFRNTGPITDTGYGPYIDLILPTTGADGAGAAIDDGIATILPITATYLGIPVVQTVLTFDALGKATHPYAKDATGAYVVVNGTPGDKLVVLQLPFGSFTVDQPPAVVNVTTNISNLADVGTPLTIQARSGFQYGATPLDDWCCGDPSIIGSYTSASVTPTLFTLTKTYVGPESETATGPNYLRQYRVAVAVANGQTITNLDLTDVLPNNLQFAGSVTTTIRGVSTSTTAISTPSTTTPGGTLTRRFASVTGTGAANDAEMLFTFYVPLTDSVGSRVIDASTGNAVTSPNNASTQGSWTPLDSRDAPSAVSLNPAGAEHTLNDRSIAIQKSVATNGNPRPGAPLTYTLNFQVSDFFAFQGIVITDTVSDGQHWDASFTPTLEINGNQYSLSAAGMNAANYTIEPHYTGGGGPLPTDGTTLLYFRVSNELVTRGQSAKLIGGCINPVSGSPTPNCGTYNDGATTGTIVFRTTILDKYTDNYPSGNASLNQGDSVNNSVVIDSLVLNTGTLNPTGSNEQDTSAAGVTLAAGVLSKSLYAINGVVNPGTNKVTPGDDVTYVLTYTLIFGDFEKLTLTDYLPLPVFKVDDPNADGTPGPAWSLYGGGGTTPPTGQWKRGPNDTQQVQGTPVTVTHNINNNALVWDFGTYDDVTNTPRVVEILFTVTTTRDPFADGLFLTNQVRQQDQNTGQVSSTADALTQIQLTEPSLCLD